MSDAGWCKRFPAGGPAAMAGGLDVTRLPFGRRPRFACNELRRLWGPWQDETEWLGLLYRSGERGEGPIIM
jgi:hypothetical protein